MNPFFPLLALLGAGCADASLDASETSALDTGNGLGDADTGHDDSDTGTDMNPAWYVVRAELTIVGGAASADAAALTVDVVDADLARTNCDVDLDPRGLAAANVPGVEAGSVWWTLPVIPAETSCAPLPSTLTLGVGSLVADVRARLGAVGRDTVADSLFGAWLLVDGVPRAYGYAGTATDLLGDDAAALPPPDGLYRLAPLYLVPLPE